MTGPDFLIGLCMAAILAAVLWAILNLIYGDDE